MNSKDHHTGWLSPFVDSLRMKRVASYIKEGDTVLDVGCGDGHLRKFIKSHSVDYVGIDSDLDPTAIYLQGGRRYAADATRRLSFEDNYFDVIVMASFLEHIEKPWLIFHEMERVLKPRGIIVATTPTPLGGKVHKILANLGALSKCTAEDHTHGFLDRHDLLYMKKARDLAKIKYEKFQFGLNQIVVWKKI